MALQTNNDEPKDNNGQLDMEEFRQAEPHGIAFGRFAGCTAGFGIPGQADHEKFMHQKTLELERSRIQLEV